MSSDGGSRPAVSPPRGYLVETPAFTGPFDLLLQLITRHQVDIYDVPLAAIVDDYLAEVSRLQSLDLAVATEFLVIAATLIELKTTALLPRGDESDLDEELALFEERDLLIARLLELKTFSDVARVLERRFEEGAGYFPREGGTEERFVRACPDLLAQVTPADLAVLAEQALAGRALPAIDLSHIALVRASVRDAMGTLVDRLSGERTLSLRQLSCGAGSRLEVVVLFLGLLELYKQGLVELHQAAAFGELSATWVGSDGSGPDWSAAREWDEPRGER